jgi:branched-chain amino acid transport system substrate-binding protein
MVALLVAPPEPKFAQLGAAALGVVGSSQWEPLANYSPETAKAMNAEWFGPTVEEFIKAYQAKYAGEEPSYHSAGGYVAGLILEKAISESGSIETGKVKAVLDTMDLYAFYGRIKFDNTPAAHGLQIGHDMIYIQWQKDSQGKLVKQVVWPQGAQTAPAILMPKH